MLIAPHLLCTSCDAEPSAESVEGGACPACGSKLVVVRADDHDDMVGKVIDGRFEIRDRIGVGGMGAIYRAWQRSIGRDVAIKLLDKSIARDLAATKRFLREARLASQLSHPNSIAIIDFGQADNGQLFIVMELLRGRTLQNVLATEKSLPLDRVLQFGVQICDAVAEAHKLQILHRDLKLENVMLIEGTRADFVKVVDFGLAKSLADGDNATQLGIVIGTPQYLAPEAFRGVTPSFTNDIYAVGVMLGEMITGEYMWPARDHTELFAQKLELAPALGTTPEPLRTLILRLLHRDPSSRPATMAEVGSQLQRMIDKHKKSTGPAQALRPPVPAAAPRPASAKLEVVDLDDFTRTRLETPPTASKTTRDAHAFPTPKPPPQSGQETASLRGPPEKSAPPPSGSIPPPAQPSEATPRARGTTRPPAIPREGLAIPQKAGVASLELETGWDRRNRGRPTGRVTRSTLLPPGSGAALKVPSRRTPTIVIGVVILAAAAGGGIWWTQRDSSEPARQPAPVHAAAPIAAAPSAEITVDVTSSIKGAVVSIGTLTLGPAPTTIAIPRGTADVTIKLTAKGRTTTRTIVPDHDQALDVDWSKTK